jgi:hypothetical protein
LAIGRGRQPRRTAEKSFIPIALPAPAGPRDSCARAGAIEIVLAGNLQIIFGQDFDAVALKRVIEALDSRSSRFLRGRGFGLRPVTPTCERL